MISFFSSVRTLCATIVTGTVSPRFFFILILTVAGSRVSSAQQFPSDFWNKGKAVLENGDTIRGQLKYNLQNDILQFQDRGHSETYSPRKIVFFEIFDQLSKHFRQFYSLPYANAGQYRAPVFFELLTEGKMTLLCRENLEYKVYSSNYYYGSQTRLVLVNHFFFLKEDGSIAQFTGKKSDLYDLMGNRGDDVKKFAHKNRLNFENKYGLAAIVDYYNSPIK